MFPQLAALPSSGRWLAVGYTGMPVFVIFKFGRHVSDRTFNL
jgi:hypothetical protein